MHNWDVSPISLVRGVYSPIFAARDSCNAMHGRFVLVITETDTPASLRCCTLHHQTLLSVGSYLNNLHIIHRLSTLLQLSFDPSGL